MSKDLTKTLTYLVLHLGVGFAVAYLLTGSLVVAGGIALIEPAVNAVAFFFHEKAWKAADARSALAAANPVGFHDHRISPA